MVEPPETTRPGAPGTLKRRTVAGWIGLLLTASLAVSGIIGAMGANGGFDWSLAAVAGTAFGTIVLAAFTGALAWTTSGDVRATWELAELTRRDQAERERPLVILQKTSLETEGPVRTPPRAFLHIWLRNVGLGPALRVEVSATFADSAPPQASVEPAVIPSISPAETAEERLEVTWGGSGTTPPRADGFPIVGKYLDRSRRHEYRIVTSWDEPIE